MRGVILAEDKVEKMALIINNRERIQLVLPDDIICLLECCIGRSCDKLLKGRHEGRNLLILRHSADTIVTAGYNAQQLSVCGSILCDCNGRETI